jgi:hypothetical protein
MNSPQCAPFKGTVQPQLCHLAQFTPIVEVIFRIITSATKSDNIVYEYMYFYIVRYGERYIQ